MDGPLALSLGLERREDDYLEDKPVKRSDSIVTKKMLLRIAVHSILIVLLVVFQKLYNFINASILQTDTVIFCFFVLFQLFNAINAREIGTKSVLFSLGKNKLFSALFFATVAMQILFTEFAGRLFNTVSLGKLWVKVFCVTFAIIVFSELYKLLYRFFKKTKVYKMIIKRRKFA